MVTISLCMIVKNEEEVLGRCLDSVRMVVDEIIIIDTGSTDKTKEIAKNYTEKVYDFQWIDNFSAARNSAFEKATMDYILWMDADDILLPEDQAKFMNLKMELKEDTDVVMMLYHTAFDEEGRPVFSYYRERLSKRSCHFQWQEPVHEYLQIGGKIIHSDVSITHAKIKVNSSSRNLEIYQNILKQGQSLTPRGSYYYARELTDHARYEEAIQAFSQFLESNLGWVEDNIGACNELSKCYNKLNNPYMELQALFRSFQYDKPRAEQCCQIGYYFKNKEQYNQAAFWFELALKLEKPKDSWGFFQEDCWGFIPNIECAVCYDKLGNFEKAEYFNEEAAKYKPNATSVQYNRAYFNQRRGALVSIK